MLSLITSGWEDYSLLDSGNGLRLERFGKFILVRPDPQIIWKPNLPKSDWDKADAIFIPSTSLRTGKTFVNKQSLSLNKSYWKKNKNIPDKWQIKFKDLKFWIKLSPFKHTGVFPEQAVHWEWMEKIILQRGGAKDPVNLLNLFGYTGIASLVAAKMEAKVTHVDASYPAIGWARENQKLSGLENKPIRWIFDDAIKFTQREIKRGIRYDGIVMDPPIYGHGPKGEIWNFNKDFPKLLENCSKLLSNNPLFIIINAYAISSSAIMLENVFKDYFKNLGGKIEIGELAIKEENSSRLLSTGIFCRWQKG